MNGEEERGMTEENLPVSLKRLTGEVLDKGVGEHVVRRAVVDLDRSLTIPTRRKGVLGRAKV